MTNSIELYERRKKLRAKQIIRMLLYTTFILVIFFSAKYIVNSYMVNQEAADERELLNDIELENAVAGYSNNDVEQNSTAEETEAEKKASKEKETRERMLKVKKLQEQNEDIVGWLEIEGTSVSYPVLQGDDNVFYLTHNYKKEETEKGSIFLNADYDWDIPSNNLVIYGHNLVNGQMFKELLKYSKEEFYKEHPVIRFTTEKKDMNFEVMSAFKSKVFYENEQDVFRYYEFMNSKSKKEYKNFVKNAKKASIYDTGVTAEYGDQLITLITCSYHTDDGRFVLIAREKDFGMVNTEK